MRYIDIENYHYDLPDELIRKKGVEPRDAARLFVYDTRTSDIFFDTFRNLSEYVPEKSLVVLNDTKVLPARLWLKKETGGTIEVFVLANTLIQDKDNGIIIPQPWNYNALAGRIAEQNESVVPVLVDRKVNIGQKIFFPNDDFFEVIGQNDNVFFLRLVNRSGTDILDLLNLYGTTPLPHYLEGAEVSEGDLRKRYQTVFAHSGASVAAPTASLHFTEQVFKSLENREIEKASITLNVGLGTFAPLRKESFEIGKLHPEYVNISEAAAKKIKTAKMKNQSIIAVGTTVARTLESWETEREDECMAYAGKTDIFIYPPYEFRIVDHLITNFHLPKTSLMLLVDAFLQHKKAQKNVVDLYKIAIENKFAFYSFGDSMLIL